MECNNIKDGFIHIDKIGKYIHNYTNNFDIDRRKSRDKIIDLFKLEDPGKGKKELSTRILYCVEKTPNGILYLKRPASLNYGFDFEVHVASKIFFSKVKTRPSHNCIITILKNLKKQNITFIWITDGKGWLTALNPLEETFNHNDYVINLHMLKNGILNSICK